MDPPLGVQLLRDIRRIFTQRETDRLFTVDLVTALCGLDESPWGDLRGKEIDARGVARRLRPYDIRPKQIRDGESKKGYERGDFLDAWSRYLSDAPSTETSVTEETTSGAVTDVSDVSVSQQREEGNGPLAGWSWDSDPQA